MQKRYTLPAFSLLAYFSTTKSGRDQFQMIAPQLKEFHYQPGISPLSDWPWPVTLCCGYLISVFVLRHYMRNRKPWDLGVFRVVHNAFLCFGSFVMVLGLSKELWMVYQKGGSEALMCDSNRLQIKGNLYSWYYIFFLSKFYEFLDTYILILRQKPVTFLHCFHHFITAFLCWLGLYDQLSVQWVIIVLNGSVHVFMYYYYLAQTLNSDVWWKKYLTTIQILQFCVDLLATSPFFYYEFMKGNDCGGQISVFFFTDSVILSFLLLFINFLCSHV